MRPGRATPRRLLCARPPVIWKPSHPIGRACCPLGVALCRPAGALEGGMNPCPGIPPLGKVLSSDTFLWFANDFGDLGAGQDVMVSHLPVSHQGMACLPAGVARGPTPLPTCIRLACTQSHTICCLSAPAGRFWLGASRWVGIYPRDGAWAAALTLSAGHGDCVSALRGVWRSDRLKEGGKGRLAHPCRWPAPSVLWLCLVGCSVCWRLIPPARVWLWSTAPCLAHREPLLLLGAARWGRRPTRLSLDGAVCIHHYLLLCFDSFIENVGVFNNLLDTTRVSARLAMNIKCRVKGFQRAAPLRAPRSR